MATPATATAIAARRACHANRKAISETNSKYDAVEPAVSPRGGRGGTFVRRRADAETRKLCTIDCSPWRFLDDTPDTDHSGGRPAVHACSGPALRRRQDARAVERQVRGHAGVLPEPRQGGQGRRHQYRRREGRPQV